MSDTQKNGDVENRERDRKLVRALKSKNKSRRNRAAVQLLDEFYWPVAGCLKAIAQMTVSEAYERVLNGSGLLDKDECDEVWQETLEALLTNIQKKKFEIRESLLAYMVKIATRRMAARWEKERRYRFDLDSIDPECLSSEKSPYSANKVVAVDLLLDLEEFYDKLDENDKLALVIGMRHVTGNGESEGCTGREVFHYHMVCRNADEDHDDKVDRSIRSMKMLAWKLDNSGVWRGKADSVRKRYNRLIGDARRYLRTGGYNV